MLVALEKLSNWSQMMAINLHNKRCLIRSCHFGKTKKHSQFKEQRFAKLGYTAANIIYHLKEYRAVLEKTKSNNQLMQTCRVYLEC